MMATDLRRLIAFQRAENPLLGFVLPEFNVIGCLRALWHSTGIAMRFLAVSTLLQRYENITDCVSAIAKPPLRGIGSIKLTAPKSP